jgi:hypothetical protein
MLNNKPIHAEVFIPEKFVLHREILTKVPGFGWGIRMAAVDLPLAIRQNRVHANAVLMNAVVGIINETAMEES